MIRLSLLSKKIRRVGDIVACWSVWLCEEPGRSSKRIVVD